MSCTATERLKARSPFAASLAHFSILLYVSIDDRFAIPEKEPLEYQGIGMLDDHEVRRFSMPFLCLQRSSVLDIGPEDLSQALSDNS